MSLLAEVLSSRTRAEIFRLLYGVRPQELYVREIQRRSGLSDASVREELRKLLRLDLVVSRESGNRRYFSANEHHSLYPEIRGLVLKTAGLVDVLRKPLLDPRVRLAFVFGSQATGEARGDSDVDLLVVGSLTPRQLSRLLSGLHDDLGREINPHLMAVDEFLGRVRSREHFVSAVMEGPKIFVVGSEDELAAMGN